jgi:hypothetical protein
MEDGSHVRRDPQDRAAGAAEAAARRAAAARMAMRWDGRADVDSLAMIRRGEGGWSIAEKTVFSATAHGKGTRS